MLRGKCSRTLLANWKEGDVSIITILIIIILVLLALYLVRRVV
jgi:uncharacterized protein HemY